MSAPVDDLRRRQRTEWWALGLLLLAIGLLIAALRWNTHQAVERAERERLDAQARAVQGILARQLESANNALVGVGEDAASWGADAAAASRRLKALCDAIPGLAMVALLAPDGHVLASSRLTQIGADLAARLPPNAPGALHLSRPFRDAAGQAAIDLALPLAAGQGGGAIVATLDADYFRVVLRSMLYADDMRAGLAHGAGDVFMFEPPRPDDEGRNVALPGSLFQRHRDSGRDANVFVGAVQLSSDDRLVALRNLWPEQVPMDAPLVLALSRERGAVLAAWRQQTLWAAGLYVVFAVGMALALAALQQRQRALRTLQRDAAARERAEAERLALALRGADLALWDNDMRTNVGTVNARWCEMLGLTPGDIPTDDAAWRALVHPDDQARVFGALQAHIDGRTEGYEATYRMHHKDGHWIWVLDRGKVLERSADGQPLRMVGTHMDISERMAAEQALRDREQQLRAMADALPGPVSRVDRDGRYLFVNAAYERWFGVPDGGLVGRLRHEVLGPERAAFFAPHVARTLAGEHTAYEASIDCADGARRWALVTLVPDHGDDGSVRGHFTAIYDISDRKRAEDALRRSEAKTRALLENLMVGVVVHRPDGDVADANPAALRLLGLSLAQMAGREPLPAGWRFVDEEGQPMAPARQPARRVAAGGRPLSNLVAGVVRPAPAATVWLLCNAFPMRRGDGPIEQILVTVLDITERRQAELERQALERQLRESQRMESIGTLAGGIAHDFNNILAAILGNVALARQDAAPGHPVQASLAQIHQAGLRARSLVQQILAFSRRDPGALVVQPLRTVIEETLSMLRATLPATVRLDARLGDANVRADATQLQQVLMNLATNAWHALPVSGGQIEVGIERIDADAAARLPGGPALAPGPAAHLWVRDNGHGMDPATQARIFDPFFTTKPVGQGTGLGLSVVHGIVRAHQGLIVVDSEPDHGSTFHLYFPSPAAESGAASGAAPAPDEGADDGHGGHGRHVLIVDDDEVVVIVAERLLQRAGFRVSTSPAGTDALARVRAAPGEFDIVVSDYNMPELSGIELAQRLAELRPELPVVLSSGLVSETLREQARLAGVRALLNKENSFDELAPTVERVLAAASSSAAAGR